MILMFFYFRHLFFGVLFLTSDTIMHSQYEQYEDAWYTVEYHIGDLHIQFIYARKSIF